jgi:hypothetical protein
MKFITLRITDFLVGSKLSDKRQVYSTFRDAFIEHAGVVIPDLNGGPSLMLRSGVMSLLDPA